MMKSSALKLDASSAATERKRSFNVVQGNYKVTNSQDAVLTTVLGSCVAACLWDEQAGVGGMNHFLVTGEGYESSQNLSYGVYAMELLINGILKRGGDRANIQAKLFGGAAMMQGLPDIGRRNGIFAREFLENEGIPCLKESLGGNSARRIKFWPATGRVRLLLLTGEEAVVEEKMPEPATEPAGNDVELF